ncbi:MAG TPA: short-chain dehydrogenase [Spirochaetia bacterium]|nr:MAG: hypothetical protein A2Y41_01135 [Spirochaetes bacterium GWB1_36_13]HCL57528.1 short-chain dehydrogenase [Spirochaetia bacterium]
MKELNGKTALVTGGASGIGKETVILFSEKGANVVIADMDEKNGKCLEKEIKAAGGKAVFIKTDVTKSSDLENMVQMIKKEFGKLDFAFNNAGIESSFSGLSADYPEEMWMKVIDVNLNGVWRSMKAEIPFMLENGGGVVVNNASVLGHVGFKTASPYSASKHAVIGLTQTAAIEYAEKGIRINAVCPGFIETPMLSRMGMEKNEKMKKYITSLHPMNRLGKAKEIAQAVIWLCREESSFMTGSSLVIDGGYLAR